jgi:hypothetical protein
MSPADLPASWRRDAELLDAHGAVQAAATCRRHADELEAALRDAEDEALPLVVAVKESGYSDRRLRELIADGTIPNAGRKGSPRVRRGDLPVRGKGRPKERLNGYDAAADAARLMGSMR